MATCCGCGSSYNAATPTPTLTPANSSTTVYTMENATTGNSVIAYQQSSDGTLSQAATFATGGLGVGHGLENQGALALSDDGKYLL